jgi:hypothetical protein
LLRSYASMQVYLYDIMVRKQKWNSNYDANMCLRTRTKRC